MQTRCHLSVLALKQAEKYGEREAFTYKDFGGSAWKTMSYNRFALLVKQASNALLNLGQTAGNHRCVLAKLNTISRYRLWCLWCTCGFNTILRHSLGTADTVYDQRRAD